MPVMGRFRLRREGRRAFFAVWSSVIRLRKTKTAFARHFVRKVNPPAFDRSSAWRAQSKFLDTRKQALHVRRAASCVR